MLKEIITWWVQQWLDLLPRQISATRLWSNALLVDIHTDHDELDHAPFVLVRRLNGQETVLARVANDEEGLAAIRRARRKAGRRLAVLIRMPAGALLEHRFAIPLAAEHNAGQVLRYEIDRVTPFTAEEVFWTWALERRDRERGRLFIRLSLIVRLSVQGLIPRLIAGGLTPRFIEAVAEDGGLRHLPLDAGVSATGHFEQVVIRTVAIICVMLGVVAVALPFVVQQKSILRTERAIVLLQPRVSEAVALRRRIEGQLAGADVIAKAQIRIGDALQALAVVTNVLPDDTFLTTFSLSGRTIAFAGQSSHPAGLIAAMSADAMINGPSFSSPVTALPTGKRSLFSINASLAP